MLIPKFSLEQNENCVFIKVHCPYSNVQDTEVYVEGCEFIFSSNPYHLRLSLPGEILENNRSTAKYECETGYYSFTFEKVKKGELFENLDMVTSLLAPKEMPDLNPDIIEVINEKDDVIVEAPEPQYMMNADVSFTNHRFAYGFANKLNGDFKTYGQEFSNVFELKTPEEISYDERKLLMQDHENKKFSSDHYLADYFDEDLIKPLIDYKAPWENLEHTKEFPFTNSEISTLKDLPNKEYLLTKDEFDRVTYNLVDILYAYCYEKRVTCNENNIESSWTINRISGTLSWFAVFSSLKDTIISSYRRSLIYPMYRNFNLSTKIQTDLEKIFKLGRVYVVKCLIEIYNLFNSSQDARYILNQLYIKDFLIFSQKCSETTYKEIFDQLSQIEITKKCLNLELEEYECAGEMVQNEESQILENTIALKMASMRLSGDGNIKCNTINTRSTVDSDDSSEDSSDSSTSSTSSDLDSDDDSDSS